MTSLLRISTCALLLSLQLWTTKANWWLLGVEDISRTGETAVCENLDRSLATAEELEFCKYNKDSIGQIAFGSRRAIVQCQIQFAKNRWNCTTFEGDNLFGKFINNGTRETAFVNAMLTAGAGHQIAVSCRDEKLDNCTCKIEGVNGIVDGNFISYGCSHDTEVAKMILNKFLGNNETLSEDAAIQERARVHNQDVGFQVLQDRYKYCRCNGISGSCAVQTCYMKAPDIEDMAKTLQDKYDSSVEVEIEGSNNELAPEESSITLTNSDLVHVVKSPSFCTSDETKGIVGTEKRECDANSQGTGSCGVLCCDRGHYITTTETEVETCQFVWCCRVECKVTSINEVSSYFCNS